MLSAHDRQRDGDVVSSTQAEDAENPAVKRDRTNNWWSQGGGQRASQSSGPRSRRSLPTWNGGSYNSLFLNINLRLSTGNFLLEVVPKTFLR